MDKFVPTYMREVYEETMDKYPPKRGFGLIQSGVGKIGSASLDIVQLIVSIFSGKSNDKPVRHKKRRKKRTRNRRRYTPKYRKNRKEREVVIIVRENDTKWERK